MGIVGKWPSRMQGQLLSFVVRQDGQHFSVGFKKKLKFLSRDCGSWGPTLIQAEIPPPKLCRGPLYASVPLLQR